MQWVFNGNGAAARTVLSVIAGSLITVAGLTFSITMVVLQLASSQFSPRILRTFFGDRITQMTIGAYVGVFVYSILVLQINHYLDGDAWVAGEMLIALAGCADVAGACAADDRLAVIRDVAATIAEQAIREAKNDRDRDRISRLAAEVDR